MAKKVSIGTYCLAPYARTEKHIRELAECGIDFVVGVEEDIHTLDLMQKYGIGAYVNGIVPGWWGGDGHDAGKMAKLRPLDLYSQNAHSFSHHPAILGIDIGDEPSALDFPHYGKISEIVQNVYGLPVYLNLYPSYGRIYSSDEGQVRHELGTDSYADYIRAYVENVKTDYICFDHYPCLADPKRFEKDLEIVSEACRSSGREMWVVLQVNSPDPMHWISLDELRYEAFTALEHGAKRLIWACWSAGWWYNQVLDEKGEKTEQYEKLRTVNLEISAV